MMWSDLYYNLTPTVVFEIVKEKKISETYTSIVVAKIPEKTVCKDYTNFIYIFLHK